VTCSARAAASKLPSSITAENVASCTASIRIPNEAEETLAALFVDPP
jgi:hypothetical protein